MSYQGTDDKLGVTPLAYQGKDGFNFALFSSVAENVELCLFEGNEEQRFAMQKTGNIWHTWTTKAREGMAYGYRVTGRGCNPQKLMLDPYAKGVIGKPRIACPDNRKLFHLLDKRDNQYYAPKGVICAENFDWGEDIAPQTPWAETIIYELHVKGFSKLNLDLPKPIRGTYAGLAHPKSIAYLKKLGITAVELLPVNYHLDECHLQERGLRNYWGYNPLAMFAVESNYWSGRLNTTPLSEFKAMVKALHEAGIEVILDVVFNHSAESEKEFPTFSQRGIDNDHYYWQEDNGNYINVTGCGNTLNVSTEMGRRWVVDCLRYWVEECHVDGFRFDLAPTLGRDTPAFNPKAQLFKDILEVPSLQKVKFIAEPWDIGLGGYQVGQFPDYFAEWNDRFRDDITKFWLWKSGEMGAFATRFAGSSDIYQQGEKCPHHSVNFITAHDGFTLTDLTSYNQKHNFANGEENRDGRNENHSYNHGVEGKTDDLEVLNNRTRSSLSLLSTLLLSNGTPMLLAGDEFGNSQQGNNNAYCQDNEITWLDWQQFDHIRFNNVQQAIALRKNIQSLCSDQWWNDENVQWLNTKGEPMSEADWHSRDTKAFQILLDGKWLFVLNAKADKQAFLLPNGNWQTKYSTLENTNNEEQTQAFELHTLGLCVLRTKN